MTPTPKNAMRTIMQLLWVFGMCFTDADAHSAFAAGQRSLAC